MNNKENKIEVMESVYARNEKMAEMLNKELTKKQVFTVNIMGAPGVGKTSSLIKIIPKLSYPSYVIEGDIESDIDTKKLKKLGIKTTQINTGGACHLDTSFIAEAVKKINLDKGYLFIENIGNLVCPAEFEIGEHVKMLISSMAEGSDKPYKYPLAFEKADIILLNKCDLMRYIDFDLSFYLDGVKKLNPSVQVIRVSGRTGDGFDEVIEWMEQRAKTVIKE